MSDCRRCGTETDRRTLADEPLCLSCADWYREHAGEESRDIDQPALEEWSG
jgi:hypothetical protein